jgi:hypothetical protein
VTEAPLAGRCAAFLRFVKSSVSRRTRSARKRQVDPGQHSQPDSDAPNLPFSLSERRQKIAAEIERLVAISSARAIAGEPVKADVEKIKTLQELLAALPPDRTHSGFYAAIAVALTCIVAVSITLMPVWKTQVRVVAETTQLNILLGTNSIWKGSWRIDPNRIQLNDLSRIELPPEFSFTNFPAKTTSIVLKISQGTASFKQLEFRPGTKLNIDTSAAGQVQMFCRGADMSGSINATGRISGIATSANGIHSQLNETPFDGPPALITFGGTGTDTAPISLRVASLTSLNLRDLSVLGLSVLDEDSETGDSNSNVSGLISGNLTLVDTGEQRSLSEGALLNLNNASGIISQLEVANGKINFNFEGRVSGLSIMTGQLERNLMPSLLEYLMHQQKLYFFWSTIVFIWGLLWSGQKLLAGNKKE